MDLTKQTVSEEQHGGSYRDHLLEVDKLYVASVDLVRACGASANNYLLTVNYLFVTLYGLASGLGGPNYLWRVAVPIAGILVCVTWWALIRNYRSLNSAKLTRNRRCRGLRSRGRASRLETDRHRNESDALPRARRDSSRSVLTASQASGEPDRAGVRRRESPLHGVRGRYADDDVAASTKRPTYLFMRFKMTPTAGRAQILRFTRCRRGAGRQDVRG
jgi:hypothetical protein